MRSEKVRHNGCLNEDLKSDPSCFIKGVGDGIGEKKWADDKAREIKESIKSGKIYNKWKERVDEEDSHSGEGWDEWYKNNGPAFP